MRYLIRSIKYFFHFAILCSVIIGALVLIGAVEGNINSIFEDGYSSIAKIAVFFAVVAAVYPKFGFIAKTVTTDKTWAEARETVMNYMKERGYELESDGADMVTFRLKGIGGRLSKMYEDRITITFGSEGWTVEGLRKDIFRITAGLERRLCPAEDSNA